MLPPFLVNPFTLNEETKSRDRKQILYITHLIKKLLFFLIESLNSGEIAGEMISSLYLGETIMQAFMLLLFEFKPLT